MNYRIFTLLMLAAAACSEPERDHDPAPVSAGRTHLMLRSAEAFDAAVYAFRERDGAFRFETLLRDGWTDDGRLSARLVNGRYKFLFASGAGENLTVAPDPLTRDVAWDETHFALRPLAGAAGFSGPADELFLQQAAESETIYTLNGTPQTVTARLERAVTRLVLQIRRGYPVGADYVEVPFTAPATIADLIASVRLTARGCGTSVTPSATAGSTDVETLFTIDAAACTPEGFARIEGPFLLPPAAGSDLTLDVTLTPAAASPLAPATFALAGRAERNRELVVTLWIGSAYPAVTVEVDLRPITAQTGGDAGIWE